MPTLFQSFSRNPRIWVEPAAVFLITLAIVYLVRRIFFGALRSWKDQFR